MPSVSRSSMQFLQVINTTFFTDHAQTTVRANRILRNFHLASRWVLLTFLLCVNYAAGFRANMAPICGIRKLVSHNTLPAAEMPRWEKSARDKLSSPAPHLQPVQLDDLPSREALPDLDYLVEKYGLTVAEAIALKNARGRGESDLKELPPFENQLVQEVIANARSMRHVYINGPRGSGKSSLIQLIGKELQSHGKEVFYLTGPEIKEYKKTIERKLEQLKRDKAVAYLLIDEVQSTTDDAIWIKLLKESKEIRVIAAGVSNLHNESVNFLVHYEAGKMRFSRNELFNNNTVAKFEQILVGHLQSRSIGIDPEVLKGSVANVIDFAHSYTGGFAFWCLSLIEKMLSTYPNECISMDDIIFKILLTKLKTLDEGEYWSDLVGMRPISVDVTTAAIRVIERQDRFEDVLLLQNAGYWNTATEHFPSQFFTECVMASRANRHLP